MKCYSVIKINEMLILGTRWMDVKKHYAKWQKTEHQISDAFALWCWRRILRVPWTARRSNQSKKIKPVYSLEGLMLKLKLQYFGHLMWRNKSLEKTLMLAKIEGKRRRGRQSMRWLDSNTNSVDMNLSKLQGRVKEKEVWSAAVPWGLKDLDTM